MPLVTPEEAWNSFMIAQPTDPLAKNWMCIMQNSLGDIVTSAASGGVTKQRALDKIKQMIAMYSFAKMDLLTQAQKLFGGEARWDNFGICKYVAPDGNKGVYLSNISKTAKDVTHRADHLAKAAQATTSLNTTSGWLSLLENVAGAVGGEDAEKAVDSVAGAVKGALNAVFTAINAVKELETTIAAHKWFAATLANPDFEDIIEESNEALIDMSRKNGPSFKEYWQNLKTSCTYTSVICMDDTCFIGTGYTIEQAVEAVLEEVKVLYMVQLVPGANGKMVSRAQLKADRSGEGWPAIIFDFSKVNGYTINVSESKESENSSILSILMALLKTNASLLRKAVVDKVSYSDIVEIPPSLLAKTPAQLASDLMTKNTDGTYNFKGARDATITPVNLLSASEYGSTIPPGSAAFNGGTVAGTAPDGRKFIDGWVDYQTPRLYKISEVKIVSQGTPTSGGGFTGATITGRFPDLPISNAKIVV